MAIASGWWVMVHAQDKAVYKLPEGSRRASAPHEPGPGREGAGWRQGERCLWTLTAEPEGRACPRRRQRSCTRRRLAYSLHQDRQLPEEKALWQLPLRYETLGEAHHARPHTGP
jgi:hypothetical protein